MATRAYKQIALGTFLLGTTALVAPAAAQIFDNQINATKLISTNIGNVLGIAAIGQPQIIQSGIGNSIDAGATGAFGFAGISQTISQSTVQQGANVQGGNSVIVHDITATNNTSGSLAPAGVASANVEAIVDVNGLSIIGTPSFASPVTATGGGIENSIGASASGAAAVASIVQSFDTDTQLGLNSLAANQIKTGDLTATNASTSQTGSVKALLNPGQQALIGDGIGNAITAQASGAAAGAAISSLMLDTTGFINGPAIGTNTVKSGDISATNRDAVTAVYGTGNPQTPANPPTGMATIGNGIGNTIGALASGASAAATVNQSIDYTTFTPNSSQIILNGVYSNDVSTGSLTAFNSKNGTVSATLGIPQTAVPPVAPAPIGGAIISNGIGNTIAAEASGASAGGSVAQRYDNVNSQSGGLPPQFAASNSVTTGTISAVNRGHVSADASIGAFGALNASLISGGTGNMIGAAANGASAGLGINQAISGSTIVFSGPDDNTAKLNAAGGMTARNGKSGTIEATLTEFGASLISNGAGNNIGASAIGAATGASVNQSLLGTTTDMSSLGSNTVIVKDTGTGHAMVARNNGTVTATFLANATSGPPTVTIMDGVANSISAQAVGATVNASVTSRLDNSNVIGISNAALPVNSVDTTKGAVTDLLAHNNGTITATFGSPLGSSLGNLQIATGVGNFIGAAAVGAGASAGITQSVSFENLSGPLLNLSVATQSLSVNTVKTGDITAKNNGNVSSTLWSPGNATIGASPFSPAAVGGVGNSIAAQSVGASADASISSRFYNVIAVSSQTPPTALATNTVKTGDLTAINTGTIAASMTIGSTPINLSPANASIFNGVNNFIGASAVGASAGAGITQSVSQAFEGISFNTTLLPANSVTVGDVTAINTGAVNATLTVTNGISQIGPSGAPISFSTGNVGNSIAAQAVGASAAASITSQTFNTSIPQSTTLPTTLATNTVKVASLSSNNSGPVTATASFTNTTNSGFGAVVSINGGVGNNIGASATGASSFASINQVVSTSSTNAQIPSGNGISSLNTLAANTINVGSITAVNSGNITASLTTTGPGSLANGILGGVGNSISANAVGAAAGVSIVQSIANSR